MTRPPPLVSEPERSPTSERRAADDVETGPAPATPAPGDAEIRPVAASPAIPAEGEARPVVAGAGEPAGEARPAPDPLRLVRWLAALGVAALVLGRFVAPALPGSGVGMGRVVRSFEILGGVLSQLFAVGLIVGLSSALIHTASTTIPAWMRLLAMTLATYAALVVIGGAASADRAPETSALVAASCAGAFAILAAVASRHARVTRLAAAGVGLVGAASVVRAAGGLLILHAGKLVAAPSLVTIGRATATASAVLVAIAVALAIVYVGRAAAPEAEAPGGSRPSLWSPVTLLALVLAVVCARQAAVGAAADAGAFSVFLKRAADRFLVQPAPYMRPPIRLFLGFLTPFAAISLLTVRRLPALTAALCLAIVAADVTDAPLGPLTLLLASLGVLLVARSGHVLWSTLPRSPAASPRS